MKSLKWLASMLAAALVGCGGGGGGGSGGSNELSLGAISPSVITGSFTDQAPAAGRNVPLSASYSGTLSGTIHVVVEDPDAVFGGAFVRIGANSTVTLDLQLSDTAPVGRFTQALRLNVCLDAACTRQLGGFPRTIPKDVTITGTTVGTTSLVFNTTAGVAGAAQPVSVTPPNGTDFTIEGFNYIEFTEPNGNGSSMSVGQVFSTAKTSTGFVIAPRALWPGRYRGAVFIATPGHATRIVQVDLQVAEAAGPVLTQATPSVSASMTFGSTNEVTVEVDIVRNMQPFHDSAIYVEHPPGTDGITQLWIRHGDSSEYTPAGGQANSGHRLRFILNACYVSSMCLARGTHTATVVYRAQSYNASTTVRVPVTFTVQ